MTTVMCTRCGASFQATSETVSPTGWLVRHWELRHGAVPGAVVRTMKKEAA